MNRRQKKKAFKKKYGMNPPATMKLECEIDWTGVAKEIIKLGKRAMIALDYVTKVIIPEFGLNMRELAKELTEGTEQLIERIKMMSDSDWEEFKEQLTEDQAEIAERIRAHEQSNIDGQTHEGS